MKLNRALPFAASFAALFAVGLTAQAKAVHGHVYVMSNGTAGNQVAVLKRASDGTLANIGLYGTGGLGSGAGTAAAFDPLGSQESLVLSDDLNWLFAVNAGSDQLSVFKVDGDTLTLTSVVPSGGHYPVSVAQKGDLVYVLNSAGAGSVSGFQLSKDGALTPIPNSTVSLNLSTPYVGSQPDSFNSPTQVQFTPNGRYLVMVSKIRSAHGSLWTFPVEQGGLLGTPNIQASPDPAPFGFTFDYYGRLMTTEGIASGVSVYRVQYDGVLRTITPTTTTQGQIAACWIDNTRKWVYTSNSPSHTLSAFRELPDGTLQLRAENTGVVAYTGANTWPIDLKISEGNKYLSVVKAGDGSVDTYAINDDDGGLTLLGTTPVFGVFTGSQGLTAY